MKKYLLVFYGGKMETDPKKAKASMDAWTKWFQDLGKAIIDMGAPTKPGKTVSGKGVKDGVTGDAITGYSVVQGETMDSVVDMTRKCPQLGAGGQVAIYEIMPM